MIHQSVNYYFKKSSNKQGFAFVRKFLHGLLSECVGYIYEMLCKLRICTPKIIVMMDGGICSQMHQFLIGQQFANQGIDIEYDLSWYDSCGVDVDGEFPRVYDLEKMFPTIKVKKAKPHAIHFYSKFLNYADRRFDSTDAHTFAPIYLGAYYDVDDEIFRHLFEELYCGASKAPMPTILKNSNPHQKRCAIHVRRGDLASGDNPWYGGVRDDYFLKAIEKVEKMHPGTKYFFFSDEIDYVEHAIVPSLSVDYKLMRGGYAAYEDLLLISSCDIIVASQGSFGKYAAMLNKDSMLILEDNKYAQQWIIRKNKTILI